MNATSGVSKLVSKGKAASWSPLQQFAVLFTFLVVMQKLLEEEERSGRTRQQQLKQQLTSQASAAAAATQDISSKLAQVSLAPALPSSMLQHDSFHAEAVDTLTECQPQTAST